MVEPKAQVLMEKEFLQESSGMVVWKWLCGTRRHYFCLQTLGYVVEQILLEKAV